MRKKIILPNIWMLLLRVALLVLFAYMYQWPLEKIRTEEYQDNVLVFWLGFVGMTMFTAYVFWTLLGVLCVTISSDRSNIRFWFFYKTIQVTGSDIDGYYKTVQKTKVSTFRGLLIRLKSGKIVEVTAYNLASLKEITDFLVHSRAPLKGDKNSWFPLKRWV